VAPLSLLLLGGDCSTGSEMDSSFFRYEDGNDCHFFVAKDLQGISIKFAKIGATIEN